MVARERSLSAVSAVLTPLFLVAVRHAALGLHAWDVARVGVLIAFGLAIWRLAI